MRTRLEWIALLALAAPVAYAESTDHVASAGTGPVYYLRGYYKIDSQRPVWQDSDGSPWSTVKTTADWVNRRLVKFGYRPFTHDGQNYYCLIDDKPRTGSHVSSTTFLCGDPHVLESLFLQNNRRPTVAAIGGGAELEDSLRRQSTDGR